MQYDESANGRQIEIKANQEFEVALGETRTAGYRWNAVGKFGPVCELLEDNIQPAAATGGTGLHRWRFRATVPGACEISLRYSRPWENVSGPVKTFTLVVHVRP